MNQQPGQHAGTGVGAGADERIRNIMHAAPFGAHSYALEADGRLVLVDANPAADRILGVGHKALMGKVIEDAFPGLVATDLPRIYREVAATGAGFEADRFDYDAEGIRGSFEVHAFQTSPGQMTAFFQDVTERRRAEEALAGQRHLLRTLIDHLPDSIYVKDASGRKTLANPVDLQYMGANSEAEVLGKTDTEFYPAETARGFRTDDETVLKTGQPVLNREELITTPDGFHRWLLTSKVPLRDGSGPITGLVGISRDITELKTAREQTLGAMRERELVLNSVSEVVVHVDSTMRIVWVNAAGLKELGLTHDQVRGRLCHEVWHKCSQPCAGCAMSNALHSGKPCEGEVTTPNGRVWHNKGFPVRDEAGVLLGAVGFARDITEQRRADAALRDREGKLGAIFRAAPVGIGVVLNRVISAVNARVCEMTGYSTEELVGKSSRMLYPTQEDFEYVGREKYRQIEERGIGTVETRWRRKDGTVFDVLLSSAEAMPGNRSAGVVFTAMDITEHKRAEEERHKIESRLEHAQKLQSLGVLAGGIAHDFNNILTTILGNAELALMDLSPLSPAYASLREVTAAACRAADLCKQMLAYAGKGRFQVQLIDLAELVREMVQMLEVSIHKKAHLQVLPSEILPSIEADVTQLRQVIMNLVINAAEAIGDQTGFITIATGVMDCDSNYLKTIHQGEPQPAGRYVYIEVSDTGCGMDKETLAKVFDPFFTTKFTGRGLGLAAVLGIVTGHKGAIKVYSEPGKGSTFKVFFPASSKPADRMLAGDGTAHDWAGTGTLLIVDDEEHVRATGRRMLERLGFHVLTAPDGQTALDVLRVHRDEITLVLLDLTMPGMDGEETYREIRLIKPEARVILCSGYNEQAVIQRFAGKGLAGFLQKPFTMESLVTCIERVFGE